MSPSAPLLQVPITLRVEAEDLQEIAFALRQRAAELRYVARHGRSCCGDRESRDQADRLDSYARAITDANA